jgi:hypothetical protein
MSTLETILVAYIPAALLAISFIILLISNSRNTTTIVNHYGTEMKEERRAHYLQVKEERERHGMLMENYKNALFAAMDRTVDLGSQVPMDRMGINLPPDNVSDIPMPSRNNRKEEPSIAPTDMSSSEYPVGD